MQKSIIYGKQPFIKIIIPKLCQKVTAKLNFDKYLREIKKIWCQSSSFNE